MSSLKDRIINDIIEREGGYSNDSQDSGGETNWGITINVARRYGYTGRMRDMSRETAFNIYSSRYWHKLNLDAVEEMSAKIAEEMADTGVNMGTGRAGEYLQRSLNVLNKKGTLYRDLQVDGKIGRNSLIALEQLLKIRGRRGENVLYKMLNSLQGAFYIRLAERREKDERFIFGWFNNRVQ